MNINLDDIKRTYEFVKHKEESEIRLVDPHKKNPTISRFAHNEDEFVEICKEFNGKYNVYVGINERRNGGTKKEDVLCVKTIVVDCDSIHPKDEAATKEELEKAEKIVEKIIKYLEKDGFKKPMKMMSGNGYQLWFAIPEIEVNGTNKDIVERKLTKFQRFFMKKYNDGKNISVDNIGDLPRIVKIAGTWSIKGNNTEDRPYRIAEWCEDGGRDEDNKLRDKIMLLETEEPKQIIVPDYKELTDKKLKRIFEKDEKLKSLYEGDWSKYYSRSEAEQALVCKLHFYEIPKSQIWKLMEKCGLGKWQEKVKSYRELTYKKAIEFVSETKEELEEKPKEVSEEEKPDAIDFLEDENLLLNILDVLHTPHKHGLIGESANSLISFFTAVSALTYDPQNLRVVGDTSTGKTWFVLSALELIPEEMKIVLRGATKKSIYYDYGYVEVEGEKFKKRVVDFTGKVLVFLEEAECEEVLQELKPILSHDVEEIQYKYVEKTKGGIQRTSKVFIKGWPAYIGLSTKLKRDEELQTREWTTSPIESGNKYKKVLDMQAMEEIYPELYKRELEEVGIVKNAIRLLKPLPVWAFMIPTIKDMLPNKRQPRIMRDFKKIISFVKISAFLHQYQRPHILINGKEYIIAGKMDYEIALMLADFMFRGTFSGVPESIQTFYDEVVCPLFEKFEKENIERERKGEPEEDVTYKDLIQQFYKVYGRNITRWGIRKKTEILGNVGVLEILAARGKPTIFKKIGVTSRDQPVMAVDFEKAFTPESVAFALEQIFGLTRDKTYLLERTVPSSNNNRYRDISYYSTIDNSSMNIEDFLSLHDLMFSNHSLVTGLRNAISRQEYDMN